MNKNKNIVKSKFLCKNEQCALEGSKWIKQFIEGKWYNGEFEMYASKSNQKHMYEINGGWRRYWVIDEAGEKIEVSKAHMNIIFTIIKDYRELQIEEILKV